MKEHWLSKYHFLGQIMITFSVTVLLLTLIGLFTGEEVKEISSLFQMGGKGIAFSTIFQILGSSVVIASLKVFFFSSRFFQNKMLLWKCTWMVICSIAVIVVFIILFDWFPIHFWQAWVGFFLSFFICFGVSTVIVMTKNRLEGKRYDRLLQEYKEKKEGTVK
ncbi:hypothetical protein [Anaerolentibacter hominis]|uniref:hypothetical protein n=1 Tax=Anaerolentibacter hominis TaxID=3079009 RepID=UPI0031B87101